MKRGYDRTRRVNDVIHRALATMLLRDMADPRFKLVTISGVEVSRDLSYAKVFVTVLSDDQVQIKEIVQELNRAVKSIRYQLAKMVKLRIVPELKFVFDETTARAFNLSALIDAAVKKTEK